MARPDAQRSDYHAISLILAMASGGCSPTPGVPPGEFMDAAGAIADTMGGADDGAVRDDDAGRSNVEASIPDTAEARAPRSPRPTRPNVPQLFPDVFETACATWHQKTFCWGGTGLNAWPFSRIMALDGVDEVAYGAGDSLRSAVFVRFHGVPGIARLALEIGRETLFGLHAFERFVFPAELAAGVAFGDQHNADFVITASGTVVASGSNEYGSAGVQNGRARLDVHQPVPELTDTASIVKSHEFSCAVRRDGRVLCWGMDDRAQCGYTGLHECVRPYAEASYLSCIQPRPTLIEGLPEPVVSVWAHYEFALAVGASGAVYQWGRSLLRTDMNPDEGERCCDPGALPGVPERCWPCMIRPRRVRGLEGIRQIVETGRHGMCGLRTDGTVWCWAALRSGETPDPAHGRFADVPGQVPGLDRIVELVEGRGPIWAIRDDGSIWVTGYDLGSYLGDGRFHPRDEYHPPTRLEIPW